MSVGCKRARVVGLGEIYVLVARYRGTLEWLISYMDVVAAHSAAQYAARRHNRFWNFTVLTLRLPAEMEGTTYQKHIEGLQ